MFAHNFHGSRVGILVSWNFSQSLTTLELLSHLRLCVLFQAYWLLAKCSSSCLQGFNKIFVTCFVHSSYRKAATDKQENLSTFTRSPEQDRPTQDNLPCDLTQSQLTGNLNYSCKIPSLTMGGTFIVVTGSGSFQRRGFCKACAPGPAIWGTLRILPSTTLIMLSDPVFTSPGGAF